ncbi:unnamed protein product [Diatraea saccharalis]|uniref:Uncharacterized protein n=1 Tax=Diatraea saccharalis TaxID=40085 RepID=A0A9N9R4G1_9NEOP|nr:unnamed protein product [Diatraea saccharalis]
MKPHTLKSDSGSVKSSTSDQKGRKTDAGTYYEVFRNNTTAVEVVVKEVHSKTKNKNIETEYQTHKRSKTNIEDLQEEIDNLKRELARTHIALMKTKKGFRSVVLEMKKQLDMVNSQEVEKQKENLVLQLENERLKTLLDFKTNVINRFKKELNIIKRLLKYTIKSVNFAPQVTENVPLSSDTEYDEFESDLKKNLHVKFVTKVLDSMGTTIDSSLSKSLKDSFDVK